MKKMSGLLAFSFFLALMSLVVLYQPGQAADADKGYYVFDQNGALSTGGWVKNTDIWGDHWYYANADGTPVNGWKTIGGKRYYFVDSDVSPNNSDYYGKMAIGVLRIGMEIE